MKEYFRARRLENKLREELPSELMLEISHEKGRILKKYEREPELAYRTYADQLQRRINQYEDYENEELNIYREEALFYERVLANDFGEDTMSWEQYSTYLGAIKVLNHNRYGFSSKFYRKYTRELLWELQKFNIPIMGWEE